MVSQKYNEIKKIKGQANSFLPYLLFGIILVFIFAIVAVTVAEMGDRVFDELKQPQNFGSSNKTVEKINQVQSLITPAFDQLVFIILISVIIATLVIAIFTDYHPVLLGLFIIAIVLLVIISGMMADAYDDAMNNEVLSDKADEFTMTNIVMGQQFPIIISVVGFIAVLILLAKRGRATSPV